MIKKLIQALFGAPPKSPYDRGYDYAMAEQQKYGWEVRERLEAEALGTFNSTGGHAEFDRGMRDALLDYSAVPVQKEIVRDMLK